MQVTIGSKGLMLIAAGIAFYMEALLSHRINIYHGVMLEHVTNMLRSDDSNDNATDDDLDDQLMVIDEHPVLLPFVNDLRNFNNAMFDNGLEPHENFLTVMDALVEQHGFTWSRLERKCMSNAMVAMFMAMVARDNEDL